MCTTGVIVPDVLSFLGVVGLSRHKEVHFFCSGSAIQLPSIRIHGAKQANKRDRKNEYVCEHDFVHPIRPQPRPSNFPSGPSHME